MNRPGWLWCVAGVTSLVSAVSPAPVLAQSMPHWAGFYIGTHAGYGWTDNLTMVRTDTLLHATIVGPFYLQPKSVDASDGAVMGGLQLGYNWALSSQWVGGLEADWTWSGLKPSGRAGPLITFEGNEAIGSYAAVDAHVTGLGSVRGRIGFSQSSWLPYLTGGAALARLNFRADMYCPAFNCGDTLAPASLSSTRFGWVAGAGIEFMQPRSVWAVSMEYLHYRFDGSDSQDAYLIRTATGQPGPLGSCKAGEPCIHYSYGGFDVDTVRLKLNYKFN